MYPDLSPWHLDVSVGYINSSTGLELDAQKISRLLSRMALPALPVDGTDNIRVHVPPTRSDVLHACDVMEVCYLSCCACQDVAASWCR